MALDDANNFEIPEHMLEQLRESLSEYDDPRMPVERKVMCVIKVELLYRGLKELHGRMMGLKTRALAGKFDKTDILLRRFVQEFLTVLEEGHEEEMNELFARITSMRDRGRDCDGDTDTMLTLEEEFKATEPILLGIQQRMSAVFDKLQAIKKQAIANN